MAEPSWKRKKRTKNTVPRPTAEQQTRITMLIGNGVGVEVACAVVGVDKELLAAWLARAERGGSGNYSYMTFKREVDAAVAKAEASLVTQMSQAAANGDWKAAAWLLERGFGGRYVRQSIAGRQDETDRPIGMPGSFDDLDNVTPIASVRRERE